MAEGYEVLLGVALEAVVVFGVLLLLLPDNESEIPPKKEDTLPLAALTEVSKFLNFGFGDES